MDPEGLELGPWYQEERAFKRSTWVKDFGIIFVALGFIGRIWAPRVEPLPAPYAVSTGFGHPACRILLALFQATICFANYVAQPGSFKDPQFMDHWNTVRIAGRVAAYFTAMTIALDTVYFTLWAVFALSNDLRLAHALTQMSVWHATQGIILTILFYFLNWREPKWRNELRPKFERLFPGWSSMNLYTHYPQIAMAIFDLSCCTRSDANRKHRENSFYLFFFIGFFVFVFYIGASILMTSLTSSKITTL